MAALCFQATDSLLTDVISNFGNVVTYDQDYEAEEKTAGAGRPPLKPMRLPTSDRPANELRPANEPGPAHEPFPANEPRPARCVVQHPHSESGASAKPVTWKLYNKNLASPEVTFEDNGFSVKTVSQKNVAIIGKPGFQREKHLWEIKVTGYPDGLSIGICVGQNGPGIVVTYDKRLTNLSTTIGVLVMLDCDAKKVFVSPQDNNFNKEPDEFGFENPHNYEVHPYFCLPPSNNSYNKITILSIDGVTPEGNEACCIL
jgi:hypothetical protein